MKGRESAPFFCRHDSRFRSLVPSLRSNKNHILESRDFYHRYPSLPCDFSFHVPLRFADSGLLKVKSLKDRHSIPLSQISRFFPSNCLALLLLFSFATFAWVISRGINWATVAFDLSSPVGDLCIAKSELGCSCDSHLLELFANLSVSILKPAIKFSIN